MTCSDYLWQITHKLLQWLNPIEWASPLNVSPIYHEFKSMMTSPVTHQFPGRPGGNAPSNELAVKIERRLLTPKLDMEMWRIVVSEIHPNNDPKEC